MRYFPLTIFIVLVACGGPRVPDAAVANSGVIGALREGNSVTVVYQKSSTTDQMLYSAANSACSTDGKRPGIRSEVPLDSSKRIPGVDGKVRFQCV